MKNPLHRKKLQLAIKTISSKQPEKSAELDYIWVTRTHSNRTLISNTHSEKLILKLPYIPYINTDILCSKGWLDDIGLPQYKDQFNEGRVDGQMLQYLTVVSLFLMM